MHLGEPGGAITQAEIAIRLNPRDPSIFGPHALLGWAHMLAGHVDQAIEWLVRARGENPRIWYVHYALAGALGLKGDIEGRRHHFPICRRPNPRLIR
jgi:hypothetical protein